MKCSPRPSVCLALCVAGREFTPEKISICTHPPPRSRVAHGQVMVFLKTIDANAHDCFFIPENALEPKSVRITAIELLP